MDVVDVVTPHDSHCEITVAALQAGKHVICEKPMGRTLAEADAMLAAAQEAGRRLLISMPQLYYPAIRRAKEILDSGEIGRPFLADFAVYDDEFVRMSDPEHWKGSIERAGGGVLIDAGSHPLYLLLHLFGCPQSVSAMCRSLLIRDMPEDEVPLALLQGEDFSPIRVRNPLYVHPYGVEAMIEDLFDAIVEEREALAETQLAYDTLRVGMAAYDSERQGRRVELSWE